jgi:hypothetical protein
MPIIDPPYQFNNGPTDNHAVNDHGHQDAAPPVPVEGTAVQQYNPQFADDIPVDQHVYVNNTVGDLSSLPDNIPQSQSGNESALEARLSGNLKTKRLAYIYLE